MREKDLDFNNNLKKTNKYFGLNLPLWMESRKTLLIFSLVDFLFIYQIFRDLCIKHSGEFDFLRSFTFIIIWSLKELIS